MVVPLGTDNFIKAHAHCSDAAQDEIAKLEQDMDERHAAETEALEQRERHAAGPQEETTDILATDLYSFSLPPSETQKQVCRSHQLRLASPLVQHSGPSCPQTWLALKMLPDQANVVSDPKPTDKLLWAFIDCDEHVCLLPATASTAVSM